MLVWSLDDADDTLDLGDQVSESLAESLTDDDGDVRAVSYEGTRDCDSRGLRGKVGLLKGRCNCPRPFRDGGGDMDFCCGDWKPSTCSEDNSASVSWGDRFLMASQKRCARAIRSVFGVRRALGVGVPCNGDMIGVSGGVARPTCGIVAAAADTDTVAMT